MDGFGSGGLGDGEKGKNVRSRRSWSKIEEDALVLCLIEIVNNGWKSGNGFRAGFHESSRKGCVLCYPVLIYLLLHTSTPRSINGKKTTDLCLMCCPKVVLDGIVLHTLDVIDEGVWESQKKADLHVRGMCFKSWSYYLQWQDIFGRDRATREHTAAIDIVNDMLRYSETGESILVDKHCTVDHAPEPIPGLSLQDKIKVSGELAQNNNRLEYFLSLPPDEQAEYVIMLLDGRLK
ncbi:hypothetical protein ACS0TY_012981 [Phlomoides rotata]